MKIEDYLRTPITGGYDRRESEWLYFRYLELTSGKLGIVDTTLFPDSFNDLVVELDHGRYMVELKIMDFPPDERHVSRIRVTSKTDVSLDSGLGELSVDFGQLGVCDYAAVLKATELNTATENEIVQEAFDTEDLFGVAVWNSEMNAIMPFVSTGFGDGVYEAWGLLAAGKMAGMEIDFMADD